MYDDPTFAARANGDIERLPRRTSCAFREAGLYAMRDRWGAQQIYFALHNAPTTCWHDQPDNGTFELYAFGRWLMTDSGFYTYGHDAEARAWHRRTSVHQTLTLDGRDTAVRGRHVQWEDRGAFVAVIVENPSYQRLLHRRTVWFVDKRFFVVLDEATGDAPGTLDLHFQLAAGEANVDLAGKWATTGFDDANVLVWASPDAPVEMDVEEGWFAWAYGKRVPRTAFRYRCTHEAPAAFLTLLVPCRGKDIPDVSAALPSDFSAGDEALEFPVEALGRRWHVGRNSARRVVWCRGEELL